jgi:phosphotransferase system HPr (HPr) family protein
VQSSSDLSVERWATVPPGTALHARSAGDFVRTAASFVAAITVEVNGSRADGRSILELLALGATEGTHICISGSGNDAAEAVAALAELVAGLH